MQKSFSSLKPHQQKLLCPIKRFQLVEVAVSCLCFAFVLVEQLRSSLRIRTFQSIVTYLSIEECLIISGRLLGIQSERILAFCSKSRIITEAVPVTSLNRQLLLGLSLAAEGKDAFALDSKEPTGDYQAFLDGEVRYNALKRANPERAAKLFDKNESEAKARYSYLNKLKTLYGAE